MPSARLDSRIGPLLAKGWSTACVLLVVFAAVLFRLRAYGDLRLSIATLDTRSYIDSAQAPLLSWAAFSGPRPFTMNLLFRLAEGPGCTISALSMPAIGRETKRAAQDCLAPIVVFQVYLSILGWGLFILSFSAALKQHFTKIMSALVLSAVSLVPQVADWDSILTSESLTFSLFALILAFVMALLRQRFKKDSRPGNYAWMTITATLIAVTAALWILVRDTNVYTVILLSLITVALLIRDSSARYWLLAPTALMLAVCGLAAVSASQSVRWHNSLRQAFDEYITPFPSRVELLQRQGMPSPQSPAYEAWFEHRAPMTYLLFLGSHPGFVATTLLGRIDALFSENNQPYFKSPDLPLRETALIVGDLVHPKSPSTLLIDILLVLAICVSALTSRNQWYSHLAVVLVWLLASAVCTLIVTFFADPTAVERHVVFSLLLFRLVSWLSMLIIIDVALSKDSRGISAANGNKWNPQSP
jgi:hypothetical protein